MNFYLNVLLKLFIAFQFKGGLVGGENVSKIFGSNYSKFSNLINTLLLNSKSQKNFQQGNSNFENLFEKLQLLIYCLSTSEVGIELSNDISGVGVFRKDFQNFKTFFESNSGKFNSQKCNRFKKVYSYSNNHCG